MLHVLCLNWNGLELLKNMLPGLNKNLENIPSKIYIRDNGSKDGSVEFLNTLPVTQLLINHNKDSFSAGINSLFNLANPNDDDLVMILNNDIKFNSDDAIKKMLALAETYAIVGCRLMYDNGTISHGGVIFSAKHGNMPWHHRVGEKVTDYDRADREFQAVTGACMIIRAGAMRAAGLLDEGYKWAFEDIDLCLNVSKIQGGKVACCGDVDVVHLTSHSLKKNPVNKLFMNGNVGLFRKKWDGKYVVDGAKYAEEEYGKVKR